MVLDCAGWGCPILICEREKLVKRKVAMSPQKDIEWGRASEPIHPSSLTGYRVSDLMLNNRSFVIKSLPTDAPRQLAGD
jgi:hypothetical protein